MSIAPIVGDRKVSQVFDDTIYTKIGIASLDLRKEFGKKVPFSLIYPGTVDGKPSIIAAVNLAKGTPVYNIPAEYKGFPVLINYGTIKPLSYETYRSYQPLKPEISISDSEINGLCKLRAIFKEKRQPNKKYLLTVRHGVGDTDGIIIKPEKDTYYENCCIKVNYQNLSIDKFGRLIDYAFCEVNEWIDKLISNRPCRTNMIINDIKSTINTQIENIGTVYVQKIGRSTGHTYGKMLTTYQCGIINNLFNGEVEVEVLIVTGDYDKFGDHKDLGSPVYDDSGTLWGIYIGTFENGEVSAVIPINMILEDVFIKEGAEFDLL